jgi:hypothetical protein
MSLFLIAFPIWPYTPSASEDVRVFLVLILIGILIMFAKNDGEVEQLAKLLLYKILRPKGKSRYEMQDGKRLISVDPEKCQPFWRENGRSSS